MCNYNAINAFIDSVFNEISIDDEELRGIEYQYLVINNTLVFCINGCRLWTANRILFRIQGLIQKTLGFKFSCPQREFSLHYGNGYDLLEDSWDDRFSVMHWCVFGKPYSLRMFNRIYEPECVPRFSQRMRVYCNYGGFIKRSLRDKK